MLGRMRETTLAYRTSVQSHLGVEKVRSDNIGSFQAFCCSCRQCAQPSVKFHLEISPASACLCKIEALTTNHQSSNNTKANNLYLLPTMATQPNTSITHAYRHLYRASLHATLHSSPARYTIRNHIRAAFRNPRPHPQKQQQQQQAFDPTRIARTLLFLRAAAESPGLERKVFANIVRVWGERDRSLVLQTRSAVLKDNVVFQEKAWDGFEESVRGLERSLGVGFR